MAWLPLFLYHKYSVMKQTVKVSFYLKKDELKPDGTCPVIGRITVGKTSAKFSLKFNAPLSLWDTPSGRLLGKSKEAVEINARLDRTRTAVNTHYRELSALRDDITASHVKCAVQGMAASQDTLVRYFEAHNERFAQRVGLDREASTCFEYQNSLRHLRNFLKHKYRVSDIPFSALDMSFIESFDFYLRVELQRKPNTILGIVTRMRKMIKYAICDGILTGDPFADYAPLRPKPQQKYLTRAELEKIMHTPLDHPNRYLTRDMFLFSCFTGLAYRDMVNLTEDKIVYDDNGLPWIKTTRQKTGTPCEVPLLELPRQIIAKYRSLAPEGKLLLMLSCKRMNINLQKIGEACGIKRKLTFHAGRHTYASEITLSQGVPMETVSRMLGHRDLRSTRIYAKVTNDKIDRDMNKLERRLDKRFQLAE